MWGRKFSYGYGRWIWSVVGVAGGTDNVGTGDMSGCISINLALEQFPIFPGVL